MRLPPSHRTLLSGAFVALSVLPLRVSAQTGPDASDDQIVTLSPFQVSSVGDKGYGATYSTGATRVNLPLQNIPTSIITLNRQFITDTGAISGVDALKYVSGVSPSGPPGEQVTLRGFVQSTGVGYRDGLPDGILSGYPITDSAIVERYELIKGPNGVLFGSQVPGGVVNAITKQPLPESTGSLTFTGADETSLYRVEGETTGSLNASHTVYYRLVGVWQNGRTAQDGPNNRVLLAPTVAWQATKSTKITLGFIYFHPILATSRNGWFADASGRISYFIPTSRTFDEADEHTDQQRRSYDLSIEQGLFGDWKLRFAARFNDLGQNKWNYNKIQFNFLQNGVVVGNNNNYNFTQPYTDIQVLRQRRNDVQGFRSSTIDVDLVGTAKTGPVTHKLLAYATADDARIYSLRYLAAYPSTSIFNPVYNANPASLATGNALSVNNPSKNTDKGFGAQDTMYLFGERVVLVAGTRLTDATNLATNQLTHVVTTNPTVTNWSQKFGTVVKPVDGVGLFYNFAQTFQPIAGANDQGQPFKNQIGTINEGGVKLELFDRRLTGTLSYFDVYLNNYLIKVANLQTGVPSQQQAGRNDSRGFEGDIAWQPIDQITFLVGYGNGRSQSQQGVQIQVPQGPNYKAFAKYSFLKGPLKGLSLGAGFFHNGVVPGDSGDDFNLPSYQTFDLFGAYVLPHWRFQANVYNAGNAVYAAGSVTKTYIYPGNPRTVRASVTFTF